MRVVKEMTFHDMACWAMLFTGFFTVVGLTKLVTGAYGIFVGVVVRRKREGDEHFYMVQAHFLIFITFFLTQTCLTWLS